MRGGEWGAGSGAEMLMYLGLRGVGSGLDCQILALGDKAKIVSTFKVLHSGVNLGQLRFIQRQHTVRPIITLVLIDR